MQVSEVYETYFTPIQEFYKDTNVFVTGATGFLGRILVEKLLRACQVNKIFVLIREKKGKNMDTRLKELFDCIVFERLSIEFPEFRLKIQGIYGDCAKADLGISEEDRNTLITNVNLVFHCAATVNFDEKLRMATKINIRGTREVLNLSKQMKHLKFFTHVSTAYAHCLQRHLTEEFYECTYKAEQLITLVEQMPEDTVDRIEPIIVDEFPNTYAFTKTISEQLVEESHDFPVAVFRPAIIVSTFKEPLPGWINNYYGPQGVTAAAMIGLLRSMNCDEKVDANIVPVDMCVNAMLASAWDSRQKFDEVLEFNKNAMEVDENNLERKQYKVPVYHFESNSSNPINWKTFRELTQSNGAEYATIKMIGVYFFHLRSNYYCHFIATIFLHYLPALFYDLGLICTGNKPKMIQAYKKVHKFLSVVSYFCTQNWYFESPNYEAMCNKMSEQDAQLFFCDLRKLHWPTFFKTYLMGCRIYLIKDPIETLPQAKKLYTKIKLGTTFALFILFSLMSMLIYKLLMKFVLLT